MSVAQASLRKLSCPSKCCVEALHRGPGHKAEPTQGLWLQRKAAAGPLQRVRRRRALRHPNSLTFTRASISVVASRGGWSTAQWWSCPRALHQLCVSALSRGIPAVPATRPTRFGVGWWGWCGSDPRRASPAWPLSRVVTAICDGTGSQVSSLPLHHPPSRPVGSMGVGDG